MTEFKINFNNVFMDNFIKDLDANNTGYYVFVGKYDEWEDEETPPLPDLSIQKSDFDVRSNILFGKKLSSNDTAKLIRNIVWTSNTVYDMYDHRDPNLFDKDFYVTNSSDNIYKCLFNNNEQPSIFEPSNISNTVVETADGYIWKYMFTMSSEDMNKFSVGGLIPITPNTNIESSAVGGTIEVIIVNKGGLNYEVFNTGTIQTVVSNTIFRIENSASVSNGFYTNSAIYIETGSGAGSISEIVNYVSNTSGKFVTTAGALALDTSSQYIISPRVIVDGDGSGVLAYSTVDLDQGVIDKIFVQNTGSNYTFADIQIVANTIHGTGAEAEAIISPLTGHGADPANELGSNILGVTVNFIETESNTIPSLISFRQAGIVKDIKEYDSNDLYELSTFNNTVIFDISYVASTPFSEGEIINGFTSGATAEVINSSLSKCMVMMKSAADFINGEQVISGENGIQGTITNIVGRDINKYSGEILYYTNFPALTRQENSSETIKLILTI
jgi:hypothetical protein